jgi:formylglycine-generating enzyme required for sulfatase activity
MSDSELTPGALGYFLNKPVDGDVKAGARGVQFELIVYALSATPVRVNKIQIQIPYSLAVANSLDIGDLPYGWLPDVKSYNNMIILDLVYSAGCLISQSNTARFRFSINVNSQPGDSHILISESLFRDGQYVSSGATKELWVKKYDRLPFSVSYLKCTPELFVVGEKLQLQFQIAGALPEDKLRFNIVYPNKHGNPILRPFVYKPNEDPKGFKYNQGCVTVSLSSDELNEKEITRFEFIYIISVSGQDTTFYPGSPSVQPLNIFEIINPAPSSDPRNLGAITLGEKIHLQWKYDIPLGRDQKPRLSIVQTLLSINGGESRPIQPKLVDDSYQFEADSLTLWPPTATAGSPAACKASLQLIAELENPDHVKVPARSAPLVEVHAHPFSGISTATINRNADSTWDTTKKTINPAPIGFLEHLNNSGLTLPMVWIPAGKFMMGSPPSETERFDLEGPQHQVQLQGFFLGQTPITQAQWQEVAQWQPPEGKSWGSLTPNPSRFKDPDLPVENVSWDDAMEFCNRLSQRTGRHYTLPSEAQWEYACRAGSTTPFAFGATLTSELANYNASFTYADGPYGEYRGQTTKVGMFPANAWGLHDMHGNVSEWCLDHWHNSYVGAPSDGSACLTPGAGRSLRGGSWIISPRHCRAANRDSNDPANVHASIGVRPCCLLPPGSLLGS